MFAGKTSVAAVSLGVVLVGVGYQGAMGQTAAGVLAVTPTDDFWVDGMTGLIGKAKTYTLTNTGTGPLEWKATWSYSYWEISTPNGVLKTGDGGTLDAGASVAVTVTVVSLPSVYDDYEATTYLYLTNLTNGAGSTSRQLYVRERQPARLLIGGGSVTVNWIKGDTVSSVSGGEWDWYPRGDYQSSCSVSLDHTQPWLELHTYYSGSFWQSGEAWVRINSQADNLPVGTYKVTIIFNCSGTGLPVSQQVQTRTVTLNVVWPADINADFSVDVVDLLWMVASLNKSSGQTGYSSRCDVNHDKTVDTADMLLFMANWGAVLE